ncbi:MAG: hypothetical protein ACRC4W_03600 [Treponemataceae bacterium]
MKKIVLAFLILLGADLFSFEWPQSVAETSEFLYFFGQSRSTGFSTGIGFKNPDTVHASNTGEHLVTITEAPDIGWFDSPLGNAVIAINKNDIVSVYGNLAEVYIDKDLAVIEQRRPLGLSGKSGWQKTESGLEHQVLDNKNKSALNPLLLYPPLAQPPMQPPRGLVIVNRSNTSYDLASVRSLAAGHYSLYFEYNTEVRPYKTSVTINGVEADVIMYDQLRDMDSRLHVLGKDFYKYNVIYPGGRRQLLMSGSFMRGKAFIVVTLTDVLGNSRSQFYNLDIL